MKKLLSSCLAILLAISMILGFSTSASAATTSTSTGSITNSTTANVSTSISCPNITRVVSCTVNTGSASASINGGNVIVTCSGGAPSVAPGGQEFVLTQQGPQASNSFPASISYSSGGKTGTLTKYLAVEVNQGASAQRTYSTGWVRPYPNPFPSTYFYQGSTYSGNIGKDGGFQKKGTGTTKNPYYWLQNYAGTVYAPSTYTQQYYGYINPPATYNYSITIVYESGVLIASVDLVANYQRFDVVATIDYNHVIFETMSTSTSFGMDRVAPGVDPNTGPGQQPTVLTPTSFSVTSTTTLPIGTSYTIVAKNGGNEILATASYSSAGATIETHILSVPITGVLYNSGSVPISVTVSAPSVSLNKSFTATVAWRKLNTTVNCQWEQTGFFVSSIDNQPLSGYISAPSAQASGQDMLNLIVINQGNSVIAGKSNHTFKGAWEVRCWSNETGRTETFNLTGYTTGSTGGINGFTAWQSGTKTSFFNLSSAQLAYSYIVVPPPGPTATPTTAPTPAPVYTGAANITVRDAITNTVIPGASVGINGYNLATNASGVASLSGLDYTTYFITASATGYSSNIGNITISAPSNSVTIYLTPTVVVPIGSLKNFRITMVKDKYLESFYRNPAGSPKYIEKALDVNYMGIDKATFLSMSGVTGAFTTLTKGYNFKFKIDSVGLNTSDATVEIKPSFYTVNSSGTRSLNSVDVFWKDSNNNFLKAGEGGHSFWNKLTLTSADRAIMGTDTATWSGEYMLPGSSFAVVKGSSSLTAKALYYGKSYIKEDIIVYFDIKGYKSNVLSYDYNLNGWTKERITVKSPYLIGDVIRYDWQSNNLFFIKTRRIF